MVGRTVVIGDIPWVAQSADAFLSKLFACSYSIAGLNVLSANPADHLVHRKLHQMCCVWIILFSNFNQLFMLFCMLLQVTLIELSEVVS